MQPTVSCVVELGTRSYTLELVAAQLENRAIDDLITAKVTNVIDNIKGSGTHEGESQPSGHQAEKWN